MSQRKDRESDFKRQPSKFDREPRPKRSTRDGKLATGKASSSFILDTNDYSDRGQKHRQRLQDALPLGAPDTGLETGKVSKKIDKKTNGQHEGPKKSSDPTEVLRSRSYFQHGECGNARQVGRSTRQGAAAERGWWRDARVQHNERAMEKTPTQETVQIDEKSQARGDEKNMPVDSEDADKGGREPLKPSHPHRRLLRSERTEERDRHNAQNRQTRTRRQ
ncbi:G patch domain-containing protein [Actinidia chinensis var. chinensis]|uniref:G patch domain-containing protein n=1 Tax=Actinidia chinensis var. chinensis TaxID=1590841 RepID=A0A2R6RH01_ACTCC|nr:G patch domain-containing protein [Actinidia chinensis var. chinensis]